VCTPGTTQCAGTTDYQTCTSGGIWGSAVACNPWQTCVNGACVGSGDAGLDAGGDACGTVEICWNGIDDNCNGLVDCADPQCIGDAGAGTTNAGGWSCAGLPAGPGWTLVAYDSTGRPACPANFSTTADNVISNVKGAPDTCGCNCTNTRAAACEGHWAWTTNGAALVCGTPPTTGGNPIANGTCVGTPDDNLNTTFYFRGAENGLGTVAGTCSAAPTVTTKPPVTDNQGETCSLPQAGGGCPALEECVPVAPAGFQLCSVFTGSATCPNGLVQSQIYTGYSDTRGCGGCSCGTEDLACSVTGMKFYAAGNCAGSYYDMNGTCTKSTVLDSYSYKADLTTNGKATACQVTSNSQPTGTVSPTGLLTICCLP
jgi:hypothetical protein